MRKKFLIFAFILVGITSVLSQTLFTREIILAFYENELCLGVIFSGWLFFSAIGSLIGRKVKTNIFPQLAASLSIALPLEFVLIKSIRPMLKLGLGELAPPLPMIIISFFVLAPLCVILGILFVQGCRIYSEVIKSAIKGITSVYILDALGDMVGGLLFGYLFIHFFSLNTIIIVSFLNLIVAFAITEKRILRATVIGLAIINAIGLSLTDKIEELYTKLPYKGYKVVSYGHSIYGELVLVKRSNLYSIYQNGILGFTAPLPIESEEIVHFPFLEKKTIKKVLLLGGPPSHLKEVLKYPIEEVDFVLLDPKVISVSKGHIDLSPLANSRVKVFYMDERLFVKRVQKKFDIIIVDMGDPSTTLSNRFYTLEFFRELKRILTPEGIVLITLSSDPNYLSEAMKEFNGTIYKTMKLVFPYIAIVPGEQMFLMASQSGNYLTEDGQVLSERLKERNIETKYVTEYYIPYRFYKERIDYIREILETFEPRIINTDFRPISYYYDLMVTTSYFGQLLKRVFGLLIKVPFYVVVAIILALTLLLSVRVRTSVLTIGVLGATGIAFNLILLLAFQVLYGYMYHKIGIIVALFMLGLAIGGTFMGERADKYPQGAARKLWYIEGYVILYLLLIYGMMRWLELKPIPVFEIFFPFFAGFMGFFVGAAFPLANNLLLLKGEGVERTSGLLYGVDLFGACIGSFFLSILFVPCYGIDKTLIIFLLPNILIFVILAIRKT
ncbi:MAG TPA: hypothetical protein EYP60_04820 [bacterium (Candidatus Stahlbacteria)]|nr:hypothetical protein [Candidatus Stahlbacteria bacterium]